MHIVEIIVKDLNLLEIPVDYLGFLSNLRDSSVNLTWQNGQGELSKFENLSGFTTILEQLVNTHTGRNSSERFFLKDGYLDYSKISHLTQFGLGEVIYFEYEDSSKRLFFYNREIWEIKKLICEISDYVISLNSYVRDLEKLVKWTKNDNLKYLNWLPEFFENVIASFFRTVFIKLEVLYNPKSQTGLEKLFKKLKTEESYIRSDEIKQKITDFENDLIPLAQIKLNLRTQRDKYWAHLDEMILHNPEYLDNFLVSIDDIKQLLSLAQNIYHFMYSKFFFADLAMEVTQTHSLENLILFFQSHEKTLTED